MTAGFSRIVSAASRPWPDPDIRVIRAPARNFMANPDLQAFIGSVGGAPEPPEVIVAQAISSPDEF